MPDVWTPLKLRSANEGIIFEGEASGAGGGSKPVQASYSGNAVTIADGGFAALTWDSLTAGTDLLDRSSLTDPLFLAPGTYAFTIRAALDHGAVLSPGGYALAVLGVSTDPVGASGSSTQPQYDIALGGVYVVTDITQPIELDINNFDGGGQTLDFNFAACIVKLA